MEFRRLGLAVVDEQHRFGVHQRLALSAKGDAPDMLVMTATPIPRTLVLSYFGDMEVSRLTEKPAGPAADRHAGRCRSTGIDEVVARFGRQSRQAARPTGSARWWRNRKRPTSTPAEERFAALQRRLRARASASCTAA